VALIEKYAINNAFYGLIQGSVIKDDICAPLPPNSSVAFLSVPAIARAIFFPTSVEPVNAILCIPGWLTIAAPVDPSPVTIFTTPSGSSACWQTSANKRAQLEM
jgi:hypothetical protein